MRTEKQIADAVRAIRPNAKAVKTGFATKDGLWTIRDGDEIVAITFMGRRAAWHKALGKLRKSEG